jgi:asparagine synthase (glutamine-hydrolysing)
VVHTDGLALFHAGSSVNGSSTQIPGDASCAIMGRLFRKDLGVAPSVTLTSDEAQRIVTSGGQRLLERYWGRYVALLRDPVSHSVSVLRDPSGGLPCLLVQHERVNLLFSDLEDCTALNIVNWSINWDYIGALVAYSGLRTRETGFHEVSELEAGEMAVFDHGSVHRSLRG